MERNALIKMIKNLDEEGFGNLCVGLTGCKVQMADGPAGVLRGTGTGSAAVLVLDTGHGIQDFDPLQVEQVLGFEPPVAEPEPEPEPEPELEPELDPMMYESLKPQLKL
jgi:hypothetical protein